MFTPEYFQQVSKQPGFAGFNNLGAAQFNQPSQLSAPPGTGGPLTPGPYVPSYTGGGTPPTQTQAQSGGARRGGYDPLRMIEEGWKQQQAQMQQVQMQNQQREQMIQQRRNEERYRQLMGQDLNAGLRPWAQTPQGGRNPMLAAQAGGGMGVNPLGGFQQNTGFGFGPVAPSIGNMPNTYHMTPTVSPIQMLGVPGRFGETQTSGQPSHMQAGQFFGTGVREVSQPYYSSLQYK